MTYLFVDSLPPFASPEVLLFGLHFSKYRLHVIQKGNANLYFLFKGSICLIHASCDRHTSFYKCIHIVEFEFQCTRCCFDCSRDLELTFPVLNIFLLDATLHNIFSADGKNKQSNPHIQAVRATIWYCTVLMFVHLEQSEILINVHI